MINPDRKTVYHLISRTALEGFPFKDAEKDEFIKIIAKYSRIYFTDIIGFCVMGDHFHLLVRMIPDRYFSDREVKKRYHRLYGDKSPLPVNDSDTDDGKRKGYPFYRKKWSSLGKFMQEIQQTFSRFYNQQHNRRGTLWGARFKSVIVEDGHTLLNCLAYIDLNPVRAGIAVKPEDYRWNTLGTHIRTNGSAGFLSLDFGFKEFDGLNGREKIQWYRQFVTEKGAKGPGSVSTSDPPNRFTHRTRYFSDSGIIGTREFVAKNYQRHKNIFQSRNKKIPKRIKGLSNIYSMKRLSEP
jgi:REP element-mobilizing transposase RayT